MLSIEKALCMKTFRCTFHVLGGGSSLDASRPYGLTVSCKTRPDNLFHSSQIVDPKVDRCELGRKAESLNIDNQKTTISLLKGNITPSEFSSVALI